MIFNLKQLLAIRDENNSREPSSERESIQQLLAHIQAVENETRLRYRVAYEVFRIGAKNHWTNRHVHGTYWSAHQARDVIDADPDLKYYRVSKLHVIKVEGQWYRINATPLLVQPEDFKINEKMRVDYVPQRETE